MQPESIDRVLDDLFAGVMRGGGDGLKERARETKNGSAGARVGISVGVGGDEGGNNVGIANSVHLLRGYQNNIEYKNSIHLGRLETAIRDCRSYSRAGLVENALHTFNQ